MLQGSSFEFKSLQSKVSKDEKLTVIAVENPAANKLFKHFKLYIPDSFLRHLSIENQQIAILGLGGILTSAVAKDHSTTKKRFMLTEFAPTFTPMASAASKRKPSAAKPQPSVTPSDNFEDPCCCSRIVRQFKKFFS